MYLLKVLFHVAVLIASELQCAVVVYDAVAYEDYCPDKNRCVDPLAHIVCLLYKPPYVEPNSRCMNYTNMEFVDRHVEGLLETVNNLRIQVIDGRATGLNEVKLPKGYGLNRIQWDSELATMAHLHADHCTDEYHDVFCAATNKFPSAKGVSFKLRYNVPVGMLWQPAVDADEMLERLEIRIKRQRHVSGPTPDDIKECPDLTGGGRDNDYIMLLHGAATHIGCSAAQYFVENKQIDIDPTQSGVVRTNLQCYISHIAQQGDPVYNIDPPDVDEGFSRKCGCPPTHVEVEGCLCDYVGPPSTTTSVTSPTEPTETTARMVRTRHTGRTPRTISRVHTPSTAQTGRKPGTSLTGRKPGTALTGRTPRTMPGVASHH